MAKLKAYTDLEQSRKLAEILQPKSADMIWYGVYRGMDGKIRLLRDEHNELGVIAINEETCKTLFRLGDEYVNWLPCWSLAALLAVLSFPVLRYDIEDGEGGWIVGCEKNDKGYLSYYRDNPVDTCYEMILRLHEQNLI